ncbi:MAG: MBL fold metallo-hydrolase [Chitinophagales bacterium]
MLLRPQPVDKLQYSRVLEIADEIWMIEGYVSYDFFSDNPSSNVFIMRDREMVLLVDSGLYPYYREIILKILNKCKKNGAKELVLVLTQGHFDHAGNNDVILEAGYDKVRFIFAEEEMKTVNFAQYFYDDIVAQEKYYDPYLIFPPTEMPGVLFHALTPVSKDAVRTIMRLVGTAMVMGVETLADRAELLTSKTKVIKKFGEIELAGWEVGRFFLIHDGGHTPGHISIYDPLNKFLMMADTSQEINPPFLDASMQKLLSSVKQYKSLAEQGFIETVTDSHRSSLWLSKVIEKVVEKVDAEPLSRLQLLDCIYGQKDVLGFLNIWEEYYQAIINETLASLTVIGEGTASQVAAEFKKTTNRAAKMKAALSWPNLPNRLETMVCIVLREANIPYRIENDLVVFRAPEK